MLKDWIWLTTRKGLGARGVLQVLDYFGSPERAFYADPEQYDQIPGLSALARSSLREKGMEGPDRILGECDCLGLRVLTLQDGDYPERLREGEHPQSQAVTLCIPLHRSLQPPSAIPAPMPM